MNRQVITAAGWTTAHPSKCGFQFERLCLGGQLVQGKALLPGNLHHVVEVSLQACGGLGSCGMQLSIVLACHGQLFRQLLGGGGLGREVLLQLRKLCQSLALRGHLAWQALIPRMSMHHHAAEMRSTSGVQCSTVGRVPTACNGAALVEYASGALARQATERRN